MARRCPQSQGATPGASPLLNWLMSCPVNELAGQESLQAGVSPAIPQSWGHPDWCRGDKSQFWPRSNWARRAERLLPQLPAHSQETGSYWDRLGRGRAPTLPILLQFSLSTNSVFLATFHTATSSGPRRVPPATSRRDMLML